MVLIAHIVLPDFLALKSTPGHKVKKKKSRYSFVQADTLYQ